MQEKLFGYSLGRKNKAPERAPSFVATDKEDGATSVVSGGYFGQYLDMDGTAKNEYELIGRYREIAIYPECDGAIDDVVNETICGDFNDSPIEINLSNLKEFSTKIKNLIREEFDEVKRLLQFDSRSYEIFRRWYIDGRIYYHKVIDLNDPRSGIQELRYIDARCIRKIREIDKTKNNGQTSTLEVEKNFNIIQPRTTEYFIYNEKGLRPGDMTGIRIAPDAITYVHSGILDSNKNMVLSHLHKAIKAVNQLRMIEDSLVIYRISRAPERRIFYIDVGNLPKIKAEQYLKEVMSRYRNKMVYDAQTGEIRDDRKVMSMLEDFWLPRREGGRGTEITTLPGGQNLGELEDVKYFQKKLFKALNVPSSRLEAETTFNVGRASEITRDELKFQKFINRLRKKFSELFHDLLKTQLVLKGILTLEEWESIKEHVQYDYIADNHFDELKNSELLQERLNLVTQMDPYLGKYFSLDYVRRDILKQTDSQINEIDKQMEQEIKDGKIIDPNELMMAQQGGQMMAPTNGGDGSVPSTTDSPSSPDVDPQDVKRSEI
jgi:hypothetical protein